jgi:hypothetical protein
MNSISIYHGDIEIYFTVDGTAYAVEVKPTDYNLLIDKTDLEVYDISIRRDRTYIFLKPLQKNTFLLLYLAKCLCLKISSLKGEIKYELNGKGGR